MQKSGKSISWYPLPQISPVLSLEDYRRLQDLDRMPGASRNLHAVAAFRRTEKMARHLAEHRTIRSLRRSPFRNRHLLINHLPQPSAKAHDRLRRFFMPMHRHDSARQQGVQHPLRSIRRRISKIMVHAKSRRLRSCRHQGVEELIVEDFVHIEFDFIIFLVSLHPRN